MTKAELTRAYIIEKTAPVFNKKGFSGTSLLDMTTATGLSKGSIYGNFANKDEVALAVFDYNWKKLKNLLTREISKEKSVFAKLMVYPKMYEEILKDPVLCAGCPILNTAAESDDTHPRLRKSAAAAMASWKESLRKMIREGIRNHELRNDLNADRVTFAILSMIEGGIMIAKLSGQVPDRKNLRKTIEEYIGQLKNLKR